MVAYGRWSLMRGDRTWARSNVFYILSLKMFIICPSKVCSFFSTLKLWKNRVKSRPSVLCRHADKLKTMLNKMRPSEHLDAPLLGDELIPALPSEIKSEHESCKASNQSCKASSEEKDWPNYPVWMTQKPKKGDFGKLKSKKISHWDMPPNPAKAWAFGARLGNRSVLILDPRFRSCFIIRKLKQRRFWVMHVNRKWILYPFKMPWWYQICIL